MSVYGAYLEDYHLIKLIIPKSEDYSNAYINVDNEHIKLNVYKCDSYYNEKHLYASFFAVLSLHKDYNVVVNEHLTYQLYLGKITRSKRFDIENYYDGELGYFYSKDKTTFKIWTPVAKEIFVCINDKKYPLSYIDKGLWTTTITGDLELCKYYYLVRINDTFTKTIDPYGKSLNVNEYYNTIIDLNKAYKQSSSFRYTNDFNYVDTVIEEISLRDCMNGSMKDLIDSTTSNTGLGYLKDIGFTHLQFMPTYSFGGVNEEKKDDYNWGYNPVGYMSVSNYLCSRPNDAYCSINELKELIDKVHSFGMGVTLDVVFNHVYDVKTYPFSILVPGYAYHTDSKGFLTNASGCGNDVNTKKFMVRKLVIDTLLYFQKEFHVDGFRFDLMNLLDIYTLNIASKLLNKNNPNNMIYGEGWNMPCMLNELECGKAENFYLLPDYAFFNDFFRNGMKCNYEVNSKGYALGGHFNNDLIYSLLTGCCTKDEKYNNPKYSINYVECHDNYTFYDVMMKLFNDEELNQVKDRIIFALSLIAISQGIPFYHLGQEAGRTKKGCENSYKSSLKINGIDYSRHKDYHDVIESFKEVLLLRKKYNFFRKRDVIDIKNNVLLTNKDILCLNYDCDYYLYIKNDYVEYCEEFNNDVTLLFDGKKNTNHLVKSICLNKPMVVLIKK